MGNFGRRFWNVWVFAGLCTGALWGCGGADTIEIIDGDGGSGGGNEASCEVAFVTPAETGAGTISLGGGDDVDGEACGAAFTTRVIVSSTASSVRLLVNDTSVGSKDVANLTSVFDGIVFGNRGETANGLRVVATMPDGRTCEASSADIFVDCDGPACTLESSVAGPYLNGTHDLDAAVAGLQTTFTVATEAEHVGQSVRLALDGNLGAASSARVENDGGEGRASFESVTLEEGLVRVQAQCQDAEGNVTFSTPAEWIVDMRPCGLTVSVADEADPVTPALDTDGALAAIQVSASGEVTGDGCTVVRAGLCGPVLTNEASPGSNGSFALTLTLDDSATASLDVCVEVEDDAGNVQRNELAVNVRVDSPAVSIVSPVADTLYNSSGIDAIQDLDLTSGTCEADVSVDCTDVDQDVELLAGTSSLGTAPCVEQAGLSQPYRGRATFASVSLASRNDGSNTSLSARQTVAGLVGTSDPVVVQADCQAPQLGFSAPTCGGQLALEGNDADPQTDGLQFTVSVLNGGVPAVTLALTRDGASTTFEVAGNETSTQFVDITLGGVGDIELEACATDAQGNSGCTLPCSVSIVDQPLVTIATPPPLATLTSADDCGVASGLQVTVAGTTDAIDGSTALVTLGGGTPETVSVASGAWSACVDAPDGVSQTLTVTVTDTVKGPPGGTQSITVTVDTQPPTQSIAAPILLGIEGRREGTARLRWDAVPDAGGGPLSAYQLRCASAAIDDEVEWAAASSHTVGIATPATSGNEEAVIGGFRVGTSVFCAMRGEDVAGALTPLPVNPSVEVAVPFFLQEFTSIFDSANTNLSLAPLGDINGDGVEDMIAGLANAGARVFFGSAGLDTAPDVEITGIAGGLGAVVAGLGDVNGDARPDFAVTARNLNGSAGSVFVFFGRAQADPWPASITVAGSPGCGADLCFHGSLGASFFGWDVTSANFDATGPQDIVIAARTHATVGRVYVILGGPQLDVAPGTIFAVPNADPSADLDGFIVEAPPGSDDFGVAVTATGAGNVPGTDLMIGASAGNPAVLYFLPGQAHPGGANNLVAIATTVQVDTGVQLDFGAPVRGIGDFDGDGFEDVAVGGSFSVGGICSVYLGDTGGFSNAPGSVLDFTNDTGIDNDWAVFVATGFHDALGLIGDLDSDGLGDLVVGSLATGSADLFYGQVDGDARQRSSADFSLVAETTGQMVPNFVGDINGDGFDDLAIVDSGSGVTDKLILLY